MSTPRRYRNGVTNVASNDVFGLLGMPDPTKYVVFFDDFLTKDLYKWSSIHSQAAGDPSMPSELVQDTVAGRFLVTLTDVENDYTIYQLGGNEGDSGTESFSLTAGKRFWFKTCFQINDVDQVDLAVGLTSKQTDATLMEGGAANGAYFCSNDGSANLNFYMRSGSATIGSDTSIATLVDATDVTLGFYFDGVSRLYYYTSATAQAGSIESSSFPTTEMTPVFGIRGGEAVANTLNMDYVCVIRER